MSNRLPVLAEEVRRLHANAETAAGIVAKNAYECGHALIEAKALVRHGDWLPFLESAGIAERTAQRWMKVAASLIGSDTVTDLGGIIPALRFIRLRELAVAHLHEAERAALAGSTDETELCDPIAKAMAIMDEMAAMFPLESLGVAEVAR
jgi:hypothetical protein